MRLFLAFAVVLLVTGAVGFAADLTVYKLVANDGKFTPDVLQVKKGEKFKIEVLNQGKTAEEFESAELNREKVVQPGESITIFLGPLEEGEYGFFGDLHRATAKGKIIVK